MVVVVVVVVIITCTDYITAALLTLRISTVGQSGQWACLGVTLKGVSSHVGSIPPNSLGPAL